MQPDTNDYLVTFDPQFGTTAPAYRVEAENEEQAIHKAKVKRLVEFNFMNLPEFVVRSVVAL